MTAQKIEPNLMNLVWEKIWSKLTGHMRGFHRFKKISIKFTILNP